MTARCMQQLTIPQRPANLALQGLARDTSRQQSRHRGGPGCGYSDRLCSSQGLVVPAVKQGACSSAICYQQRNVEIRIQTWVQSKAGRSTRGPAEAPGLAPTNWPKGPGRHTWDLSIYKHLIPQQHSQHYRGRNACCLVRTSQGDGGSLIGKKAATRAGLGCSKRPRAGGWMEP